MQAVYFPFNTAFREGAVQTETGALLPFKALRIQSYKNNVLEMHIQEIGGIHDVALTAIMKPGRPTTFKNNEKFEALENGFPRVAQILADTFQLVVRKSDINPRTFQRNGIYPL